MARLACRVDRVPRAWVFLPISQARLGAGQGACGSAAMRSQAVAMSAAQGQLAWMVRRRWRAAAGRPGGGVQDAA